MHEKYHLLTVAYTDITGKLYNYSKPYYNSDNSTLYTLLSINKETTRKSIESKFYELYPFGKLEFIVDFIGEVFNHRSNKTELSASLVCNVDGVNMVFYAYITERHFTTEIPAKLFIKSAIGDRIQPRLSRPRGQLATCLSMLGVDLNDVLILTGFHTNTSTTNEDYKDIIIKLGDKFDKLIFYVPGNNAPYYLLPWNSVQDMHRIAPGARPKLSKKGLIDITGSFPSLSEYPDIFLINNDRYKDSIFKDILLRRGQSCLLDY